MLIINKAGCDNGGLKEIVRARGKSGQGSAGTDRGHAEVQSRVERTGSATGSMG